MYNLNDASGVGVGGAAYGGAGIQPTIALQGAGSHSAPCYYPMPMMNNCGGGFGGGFGGGDGIWAILLLSLLGRGGWGGNDNGGFGSGAAVPTIISDNINGRFSALSDQIAAGDNAIQSQITSNGIIDAVRAVDSQVCAGFLQTQKGFGDVALESCRQTGLLSTAINQGVNSINSNLCQGFGMVNSNIAETKYQNALIEQRTQAQLAACCCDIQNAIHADGDKTRALITDNTIQDLRDRLTDSKFKNSQCEQNAYLTNYLCPRPVPSTPVFGNVPVFQPVISAQSFCGAQGTGFGNYGGGCGSSCGIL